MERRPKLYGALSEAQLEEAHLAEEHEYHEEELEDHELQEGEYFDYAPWEGEAEEEIVEEPPEDHIDHVDHDEHVLEEQPQGGQYHEDEYGEFVEFTNDEDAEKFLAKMHMSGDIIADEEEMIEENEQGPSEYIHQEQQIQEQLHEENINQLYEQLFDPPGRRRATTHECEICGVFLKHPSKIAAHMRTHTGEKPFQCDVCGRKFSQRTPWRMHLKRHTQDLPFLCSSGCGKAFPNASQRNAHDLRHLGRARMGPARPHLKPAKRRVIIEDPETELREAMMDARRGPPVVEAQIAELTDDAHKRIDEVINAVAENRAVRPWSAKAVPSYSPHSIVRRTRSRRAPPIVAECHICGLLLKHPSKIQAHMRTHQGVKPFACKLCGLTVATFYALRMHHKRRHTEGDRQFPCTWECGRRFVNVSARNEHERIVHAGVKRYLCSVGQCSRLFSRRAHLIAHRMRDHPGIAHVDEFDDPVDMDYDEIREVMGEGGSEDEEAGRMIEEADQEGHLMEEREERRHHGEDGEDEEVVVVEEEEGEIIDDNVYRLVGNPPRLVHMQKGEKREDAAAGPSHPPSSVPDRPLSPDYPAPPEIPLPEVPILVPKIHKMPMRMMMAAMARMPNIVRKKGEPPLRMKGAGFPML